MATTTSVSSRSNLGPLTTTFIPPSACSQKVIRCTGCFKAFLGQSCSSQSTRVVPSDDAHCWPTATSYPNNNPPFRGLGFYSPGLLCPSGYTSACTATFGSTSTVANAGPVAGQFQFALLQGETAVGCCPTGFTCTQVLSPPGQTCQSMVNSGTVAVGSCKEGAGITVIETSVPNESALSILAPLIQINWQSSDLPASTTTKTPASSSATASTLSAAASTKGLSTAAIVGITIGSVVVLLVILTAGICIRTRKTRQTTQHLSSRPVAAGVAADAKGSLGELESNNIAYELPVQIPLRELEAENRSVDVADRKSSNAASA
ncbi:hypothetical protein EJ04DRAFT_596189 [Polyplosphaeria fusca]|uniref:Uncharacterized protein n=1 Tax=Polyplosphaeria fusca TaxID=682080 RepID=A0A9P4UWE1_9PLEO|nr:hypothetical protein EJ04DRAFT_596189 [Polyplosphaeria fusca]